MEDIIANVDDIKFDIEIALEEQLGLQPLPFPGMDKSAAAICDFFITTGCNRGPLCPLRHISGNQMVVCKHWLRGLCKKGDDCEFLHKYDMEKMPECYFYIKYGQCSNKECPFLHLNPADKIKDCPWYDRGFCKHGPHCKNRHVRRVMCVNYLCGFCPTGKKCKYSHPKFEVQLLEERKLFAHIVCHACGELGHKSTHCAVARRLAAEAAMRGEPTAPASTVEYNNQNITTVNSIVSTNMPNDLNKPFPPPQSYPAGIPRERNDGNQHMVSNVIRPVQQSTAAAFVPYGKRPLEFVTCFKCRGKGHYANRCPFTTMQRPPAGIPTSFPHPMRNMQQTNVHPHHQQPPHQQQPQFIQTIQPS